jgi:3-oxoacyl-[acyl-carrier protein] reductase
VCRLITAHLAVTKAAARHMVRQGSGVILQLGGAEATSDARPGQGAAEVAASAVEALRRRWAYELSGHGIRVITLRTGGIAEGADLGTGLGTGLGADLGRVAAPAASEAVNR